jgi:drug/metabolite transporter (DMT)-like permease
MLKGIFLVGIGAASYGVLATMVKLAYNQGYTTEEVTFSQFSIGWLFLLLLVLLEKKKQKPEITTKNNFAKLTIAKLLFAGTALGFTGLFYYRAVHFIPVSLCIILLMQSVWMGVLLEAILQRQLPTRNKIIAVILVLIGTVFATQVYLDINAIDSTGLFWGILGALSYTISLYTSNKIGLNFSNSQRSFYMLSGGFIVVILATIPGFLNGFNWSIFLPWGLLLALFGTILPPLLMNKGMPLTGIGIGSIIISIEIPISVSMAYFFLGERINFIQWLGVLLIVVAIVVLNLRRRMKIV